MKRRQFLALCVSASLSMVKPGGVKAQETGRTYHLGFLIPTARSAPNWAAFLDELGRQGFVEGTNFAISGFGVEPAELDAAAIEMVRRNVDAIITGGPIPTRAAQRATTRIPILTALDDFLAQKFVSSLAHPNGNITGVSILGPELDGKRQELLLELVPGANHIAILADPASTSETALAALRAQASGVEISVFRAERQEQIAPAIDTAKAAGAKAINLLASQLFNAHHAEIIEQIARARIAAIYQWPERVQEGGPAAYGPRFVAIYRIVAQQLAKVLRGMPTSDIPVEQPTHFELVINLKTAKALGLTVSQSLLAQADEVIE